MLFFFTVMIFPAKGVAQSYASQDFKDYQKSSSSNPSYDPFVEEGFKALDRQDLNSTIEFLKKAVGLGCQSPLVFFKLALAFEGEGAYYSAIQYYELARDQFQKTKEKHRYRDSFDENYGRALYLIGQVDKAMPYLEKAAQKTKTFWLFKLLGQIALANGDSSKGIYYYEEAIALNDPSAAGEDILNMYLELARAYLNRNDNPTARRYYEKILEIDPHHTEARNYLKEVKKREAEERVFEILEQH